MSTPYWAHPTAVVDQPVTIGDGTKIWHFTHVMPKVEIGERCSFGQNVYIGGGVKIGSNVKVQNNVSLYEGVELERDVFCGPSCVFTNVVNPRSEIVRKGQYQRTLVKRGASIGANATIVCGSTIGRYALIGAGAVVTRSEVPDYALMLGVPARRVAWVSRHGHVLEKDGNGVMKCPESGWVYEEVEPGVLRCKDWNEEKDLP
ncbi:MAG: N-acetyltransferase [Archangium sp.]|nr:N-acetyltransferase [Archangium sp.]